MVSPFCERGVVPDASFEQDCAKRIHAPFALHLWQNLSIVHSGEDQASLRQMRFILLSPLNGATGGIQISR